MPIPCTNCIVFHYGQCKYPPRQCRICWGWGHIERYCPSNPTGHNIRRERGEPLAGSRAWCERYGLDADPNLKFQVLQALKINPGSAIHINGVCIYGGSSKSYATTNDSIDPPRGRTLEKRMGRRDPRSLSPRDRRRRASGSPPGRRGRSFSPKPPEHSSYRSRGPLRQRARTPSRNRQPRTPSPGRQAGYRARSPRYTNDSNAVVFEAKDNQPENCRPESHTQRPGEAGRLTPVRFNMPRPYHALPPRPLPAFDAPRAPLGQVSSNLPRSDQSMFAKPRTEIIIDDPYFVLGVTKGANDAEILTAYQKQMYEIDLERRAEGYGTIKPNSVWNDSIEILKAAKRQLLGN
ncbi:hypothetical protein N431DRAFT_339677 [Stipitochalara longipes BDJ]|nr:hypothetical protein N431DRAFT_339677 [Stipitochalara longipes BDJ]